MSDNKKQNKPNVPNLRFPEFSGEWCLRRLEECAVFLDDQRKPIKSSDRINKMGLYPYYGASGEIDRVDDFIFDDNLVLLSEDGANIIDRNYRVAFIINGKTWVNNHAHVLKPKQDIDLDFLSESLERLDYAPYNTGTTMPKLNQEICRNIKISVPSYKEQKKIGYLLSLLNNRIAIQSKVIEKYESLIKALTQQAHKRATTSFFLRDVLAERKELNSKGFDICSVSVTKGVINQIEYLGRSFAAKETKHYHVVRHGDIVYTKSPTGDFPYGIIKQNYNENPVAVSPLYGVYEPITYEVGVYLHYYFCSPNNTLNYLHPLIQKGAKNTINITNPHFLDNKVSIPDSKVLSKIVSTIITISSRLQLEEKLLYQLQLQKQFVLSNMFI